MSSTLSRSPSNSSSSSKLLPKSYAKAKLDGHQIKVGVLGATGTVGQRFIVLLSVHPFFTLEALGASSRSAGKPYRKAVAWKQTTPIPASAKDMVVRECLPENFADCAVVFSGLDADAAGDIESAFRSAELAVFSNAKNYRRDPHVPLIVPLVNSTHFAMIPQQRQLHSPPLTKGFIVTNANCSTTGFVVPLHAMEKAFGPIESCMVTTMQAISGGGYPGVPSLDILDNVVPYISGEEEKMEWETLKILGGITDADPVSSSASSTSSSTSSSPSSTEDPPLSGINTPLSPDAMDTDRPKLPAGTGLKAFDMHSRHPLRVSASCNRVPVIDGHTECVSVRFSRRPPPSPQQVREALAAYTPDAQTLGCPSAPRHAIVVHEEPDRPQPRLDRYHQDGAGISVGRVRQCQVLDIKFVCLANNVSIGAATSSIINAEIAVMKGILS